ncbi:GtrA family protein [Actinotalea subterranea]|uniref:GtrA family protein n=1 Tax=Actinotalea subterranea TaxID=2607497 RepID=UPI0011EC9CF4|nr:GtrA family protein [Actinotalea subterranea]
MAATTDASVAPLPVAFRTRVTSRVAELARFGSVGAVAYVVDVGIFNLLRFGPGELLAEKPITARIVAAAIATMVAWVGNRYWTFSSQRTATPARELLAFAVINVVGMGASVACLFVSHYVLGLTSALADNISANVVGVAVGTAIRYLSYRKLVFTGH